MNGERFGVTAGGLQARVNSDRALLKEPVVELLEAVGVVRKLLISEFVVA
jgi:hypothetical protein